MISYSDPGRLINPARGHGPRDESVQVGKHVDRSQEGATKCGHGSLADGFGVCTGETSRERRDVGHPECLLGLVLEAAEEGSEVSRARVADAVVANEVVADAIEQIHVVGYLEPFDFVHMECQMRAVADGEEGIAVRVELGDGDAIEQPSVGNGGESAAGQTEGCDAPHVTISRSTQSSGGCRRAGLPNQVRRIPSQRPRTPCRGRSPFLLVRRSRYRYPGSVQKVQKVQFQVGLRHRVGPLESG